MQFTEREVATILAALDAWKDELSEGTRWIQSVHNFDGHRPLSSDEVDCLRDRLKTRGENEVCAQPPARWSVLVPTYVGSQKKRNPEGMSTPDFAPPLVPVLIHEADGVRLVLGTHDYDDRTKPDVQIERRPHGWAIFLHPEAGDSVGCAYYLDDGRSFFLPERFMEDRFEIVDDIPPELDEL
jgi:hypothetical protein